jgi:ABC-type lipoprotein export system ATPase subunit
MNSHCEARLKGERMSQAVVRPLPTSAPSGDAILRAGAIHKSFKMGDSDVHILKGVNFDLQDGEFVAIEGRSGSGKSTLLHILGALESISEGNVEFDGKEYSIKSRPEGIWFSPQSWSIRELWIVCVIVGALAWGYAAIALFVLREGSVARISTYLDVPLAVVSSLVVLPLWKAVGRRERVRATLRNRQFGFIFQFYHLLPELNVVENAMLAAKIQYSWLGFRIRKSNLRKRAVALLEQLGMSHRLNYRPNHLSGGERQRVAIARALMNSPRILFADEPTGNLDADTGRQIMDLLENLHREHGQTIVMVTHDRALAREADRILILKDGKLESPA